MNFHKVALRALQGLPFTSKVWEILPAGSLGCSVGHKSEFTPYSHCVAPELTTQAQRHKFAMEEA